MGAKTASKPRLRNIAFKCDICGRKFTKLDGLKSHQRTIHDVQPQQLKMKQLESKTKNKPDLKKTIIKNSRSQSITSNNNQETVSVEKKEEIKHDVVEFECPKCFRMFQSYFPALKHIQKFHCVNKQGTKVSPNSPFLIKPIRLELCRKCNRKVKSIHTHVCDFMKNKKESETYACTGCDSTFTTWRSFDIHVVTMHGDELESLFFPSDVEFAKWKLDMENQTKAKYNLVDKYEYKCFYHCTFESAQTKNNVVTICPSTIVVQELSKGIQVSLYKNHYKHSFVNYKLANKYNKYRLDAMIKEPLTLTYIDSKCDDNDLYVQFRTIMEKIVMDAAKVDINTLKILLPKARDMNAIISSYEDKMFDSEDSFDNKIMKESDILNELMNNKTAKRKAVPEQKIEPVKRPKADEIEEAESIPKIVNCYSLSNEKALKEANQIQNDVKVPTTEILNNKSVLVIGTIPKPENTPNNPEIIPQPLQKKSPRVLDKPFSTFDESYADFLSKNFVTKENQDFERKRTRSAAQNKRKPVVKTKIGQFKGVSPKKEMPNTVNKDSSSLPKLDLVVQPEKKPLANVKLTPTSIKDQIIPLKPDITNQPQKDVKKENKKDLNQQSSKKLNNQRKKSNVPKKIVNLPRRIVNLPKKIVSKPKPSMKPKFSSEKPKVDVVYEVKEQQDDCNILILKI